MRYTSNSLVLFLRGAFGRCPRCGGGRVINWRKVDIEPDCPTCGMHYEREEGFFLGAFVVNFGVVLITLAAFIGISVAITLPDPPRVPLVVAGILLSALVAVVYYPCSKTVWTAFYLMMMPLTAEEQAAAEARTRRTAAAEATAAR